MTGEEFYKRLRIETDEAIEKMRSRSPAPAGGDIERELRRGIGDPDSIPECEALMDRAADTIAALRKDRDQWKAWHQEYVNNYAKLEDEYDAEVAALNEHIKSNKDGEYVAKCDRLEEENERLREVLAEIKTTAEAAGQDYPVTSAIVDILVAVEKK